MSADASRTLIGDDEHGWSDTAVFNFEGGCYAKMIRLSAEAEPEIYATTKRFGTVLENVVIDPATRELDLDDPTPRREQPRRLSDRLHPEFLGRQYGPGAEERRHADRRRLRRAAADRAADARPGDVPFPLGLHRQGRRHRDRRDRAAGDLLDLLRRAVHAAPSVGLRQSAQGADRQGQVDCWLVNTGWTGGKYGVGKRMPIKETRALLNAALDGSLNDAEFRKDPNFGFEVPVAVPGVDSALLDPRSTWPNQADYDATAAKLVDLFVDNFAQFADACRRGRAPGRADGRARKRNKPRRKPRRLRPGRRSGQPEDPIDDRLPPATIRYRRRDRASRRGADRAHACRAPSGPTRRISQRRPGCC